MEEFRWVRGGVWRYDGGERIFVEVTHSERPGARPRIGADVGHVASWARMSSAAGQFRLNEQAWLERVGRAASLEAYTLKREQAPGLLDRLGRLAQTSEALGSFLTLTSSERSVLAEQIVELVTDYGPLSLVRGVLKLPPLDVPDPQRHGAFSVMDYLEAAEDLWEIWEEARGQQENESNEREKRENAEGNDDEDEEEEEWNSDEELPPRHRRWLESRAAEFLQALKESRVEYVVSAEGIGLVARPETLCAFLWTAVLDRFARGDLRRRCKSCWLEFERQPGRGRPADYCKPHRNARSRKVVERRARKNKLRDPSHPPLD
ncbi:MAG: hypothetical protein WD557_11885 [Dehalococcoidia bacterium]